MLDLTITGEFSATQTKACPYLVAVGAALTHIFYDVMACK